MLEYGGPFHPYNPALPLPPMSIGCGCPRCVYGNVKARNDSLMENMPAAAYAVVLDGMLIPLLWQLHAYDKKLFPASWIANPSDRAPVGHMPILYHRMCLCVHKYTVCEGDAPESVIQNMLEWARTVFAMLVRRKRRNWTDEETRLDAQIHELVGSSSAYCVMNRQVVQLMREGHADLPPCRVVAAARSTGTMDEMLKLSCMFYSYLTDRMTSSSDVLERAALGSVLVYLEKVRDRMLQAMAHDESMALALAMALHPRLGAGSAMNQLGVDLVTSCLPRVKGLNTWTTLLAEWL